MTKEEKEEKADQEDTDDSVSSVSSLLSKSRTSRSRSFDSILDSSIALRSQIMASIQKFEHQLSLIPDKSYLDEKGREVHPVPELVEEGRTELRLSFYSELNNLFTSLREEGQLTTSAYEEAVYLLILDRMRRSFGYYQALARADAEINRRNADIGDASALTLAVSEIQGVLSKLDDIDFTRSLCVSLGMDTGDTEEIIKCMIHKEFSRK